MQISAPWGLTAYGTGTAVASPDLARVRLAAERVEPDAAAAFGATRLRVAAIREAMRAHGVPDEAVQESRLTLSSEYEGYGIERKFLGYRCEAGFTVELGDLDIVEPMLVAVTDAGANRVDEVTYTVRDAAALASRARSLAVSAALTRASELASASGVRLGAVLHVEDLDAGDPGPVMYRMEAMAAPPMPSGMQPGAVSVRASVLMGWALLRD
ncbi:SIMPL domain-containing protein [Actinorhabdospora filicis]|uniref:SIMPL domain-containing protein n=1 Tax=Actinorhabdospora filicis TaxID=1785913 RepID=A0A9W6W7X3_9ACTN|nr:SIMPL domain-containing protein [Actinorhabdospora filicis]GLZ76999.1 SIMPL domain-containing protein [Actinorhabdospora filicis]